MINFVLFLQRSKFKGNEPRESREPREPREARESRGGGRGETQGNRSENRGQNPSFRGSNEANQTKSQQNVASFVSSGPQLKSAKQINKPDSKPSNNNQSNAGVSRNMQNYNNNNTRQPGGGAVNSGQQQPSNNKSSAFELKPVLATQNQSVIPSQQHKPTVGPGSGGSSHPSTSSIKSNSFDQHDSGVESALDQPPSTSSTSTSQRSSPSNDDNKVVSSTANSSAKLTATTNSSSSVKCSTSTTTTLALIDSKVKKSESLNISKIPDMVSDLHSQHQLYFLVFNYC